MRQLWLLAGSGAGGNFHLQIVTFAKVCGGVVIFLLFENVISRRGGVTQYQIAFAFKKQAEGFAPAFGDRDSLLRQFLPGLRGVIAIEFLHP